MTNPTSTKEEQLLTYGNYPHSEGLEEEVGEVLSIRTLRLEMRLVRPGSSFRIFSWLFLVILHESRPLFPVPNWQEWPLPSGVFCCWSPSS